MPTHLATIRMDEEHSRAIIAEIGDRLRIALGNSAPMPPYLAKLVGRLRELDDYESPSIVPSIGRRVATAGISARAGDSSLIEA